LAETLSGLPERRGSIASPKNEKTALSGRGIETIHNVSSRSRGCGGSAATSVNARASHHERIDLSRPDESQGLFCMLRFAAHFLNTEQSPLQS
jgi:hypothetical protein